MSELETVKLQRALHEQIKRDLEERLAVHKREVVQLRAARLADPPSRPLNLVAVGDSWFDYPLGDIILGVRTDLLVQLERRLAPHSALVRLAHHGDAVTDMLGVHKQALLASTLSNPKHGPFDAILFSGGGNDLAGEQFRLWLLDAPAAGKDPRHALNETALKHIIGVIETGYLDLIRTRDDASPGTPIFVHTYDFALPTNLGVCTLGPWLYPSLHSRHWMSSPAQAEQTIGAAIIKILLQRFDDFVAGLASNRRNNLIHVKTQGTLVATDWANELHPNPPGFRKIGDVFADALGAHFGAKSMAGPENVTHTQPSLAQAGPAA